MKNDIVLFLDLLFHPVAAFVICKASGGRHREDGNVQGLWGAGSMGF